VSAGYLRQIGGRTFWVFQQRQTGQIAFNRNWDDYVSGFGDATEFWAGLENIHDMIGTNPRNLRVEAQTFDGQLYAFEWLSFTVGDSSTNYTMNYGSFLSANSTIDCDFLSEARGHQFSTFDRDNDAYSTSCSTQFGSGGYWWGGCMNSNPNGVYSATLTFGHSFISSNCIRSYETPRTMQMMLQMYCRKPSFSDSVADSDSNKQGTKPVGIVRYGCRCVARSGAANTAGLFSGHIESGGLRPARDLQNPHQLCKQLKSMLTLLLVAQFAAALAAEQAFEFDAVTASASCNASSVTVSARSDVECAVKCAQAGDSLSYSFINGVCVLSHITDTGSGSAAGHSGCSSRDRRIKLPFNRNWDDYVSGFGDATEFWAGLENIHNMTATSSRNLRVEAQTFAGEFYAFTYLGFSVGDSSTNYRMNCGSFLSSNSTISCDFLFHHRGQQFSTFDRDNDAASYSCSTKYGSGGFWWGRWMRFNPNSVYSTTLTTGASYMASYCIGSWEGPPCDADDAAGVKLNC
uniref:Fibrinogen C-terminal domain-containing protein n=1 Tax=Macrostomum lignano TaxID=282301 RepID=A0A1I8IHA7_9PLAT